MTYADRLAEEFADPSLEPFTGDLPAIRQRRLLRALVTPSRTDFFVDSGEIRGIQAEFLRAFVAELNQGVERETERLRLVYVPVPFDELVPSLQSGRGDVVAAFLTETQTRAANVAFAAPFRESVSEVLVTHVKADVPDALDGLAGRRVYVLSSSSYAEHLRALSEPLVERGLSPIDVEEADSNLRSEDILELVNAGVVELTAVDDYKAQLWARVLPDVRVHEELAISTGNRVSWAVREDSVALRAAVDGFARRAREGALLGNVLLERYFDSERWLRNPNTDEERDKLQRFLPLFAEYGERYGFDPLALAAQAYHESQLDPTRRSPAGAVGLMQVLPSTARDPVVGIPGIEDPDANVHAGAKYLAFLRDRYFAEPELTPATRRAFGWAAYNAGPRKIREARALAKRLGLDPDRWFGHVEVATARIVGREPVRYVANVHRYHVAYRLSRLNAELREAVAAPSQ